MKRFSLLVAAASCIVLCGEARASGTGAPAIEADLRRIAGGPEIWPGYDPLLVPLAVFDGENTQITLRLRRPTGRPQEIQSQ